MIFCGILYADPKLGMLDLSPGSLPVGERSLSPRQVDHPLESNSRWMCIHDPEVWKLY